MIRDCTSKRQTMVIEYKGRPDISGNIEDIQFCMANLKESEVDEFNQKNNVYYAYKVMIGEDGHPQFVCIGKYDE